MLMGTNVSRWRKMNINLIRRTVFDCILVNRPTKEQGSAKTSLALESLQSKKMQPSMTSFADS